MPKFLIFFIAIVVGCGPDSDPTETDANNLNTDNNANNVNNGENNANQNNTDNDTKVPMTMIFAAAFEETGCTGGYCHGGSVDGLVINTADVSVNAMVDVASSRPACGLTKLVVPGEPEQSLLWMRVRPEALDEGEPCVEKMPRGTTGLSEEKAALIFDWISYGAEL